MKVLVAVLVCVVLLIGVFVVLQLLSGPPTLFLDRDGAVFMGRRRIAGGDEPDLAERLRAHLERRRPLPVPLRIEAQPGAVVEDLVIVLWAARKGGAVKDVVVRCGSLEEPLELLPVHFTARHELIEVALYLCARNDLNGHLSASRHEQDRRPGDRVAICVERYFGASLGWPGQETEAGLKACFDGLRADIAKFNRGIIPLPQKHYAYADCCPGIPVEYALRACRTLREAGSGEPTIRVKGVGTYAWPP